MANDIEVRIRTKDDTDFGKSEKAARGYGDALDEVGEKGDRSGRELKKGFDVGTFAAVGLADSIGNMSDVVDSIKGVFRAGSTNAGRLARAQLDVEQSALDAAQAEADLRQSTRDASQSFIDIEQAQLDARQAQDDYSAAVAEFGAGSIEAQQALIDQKQAQEDLKQAQEDGKQATLDGKQATVDATQANLDMADAQTEASDASGWSGWLDTVSQVGPAALAIASSFTVMSVGAAKAAASAVATAAKVVASWVLMSVQATIHAARIAVAWLVAMGPIALVIAAVVGLVVVIVKNWGTIRDATAALVSYVVGKFNALIDWFRQLPGKINSAVRGLGSGIAANFRVAHDTVRDLGNRLVDWFRGLPGRVSSAVSGMFRGLGSSFRSAINGIIGGWNRLSFTIGGGSYDPLGQFGPTVSVPSFTFNTPNIPYLARGGIAGGLAMVGERGRELVRLPHGSTVMSNSATEAALGRSGGPIQVSLELRSSGARIDDLLLELLRSAVRVRGGDVQLVIGVAQ